MDDVEKLAESVYLYCCKERSKKGEAEEVCCPFDTRFDEVKEFYRNVARWHLQELKDKYGFV